MAVLEALSVLKDRYDSLTELGEGGFGTVYKARQVTTGQAVAIKVLRLPEGDGEPTHEKRIARFQREMRLCAQLHHPNIVRIMDSGHASGRVLYSVFEYVPGKNLGEILDAEGALEPGEARHLLMQVLDALGCAHAQGVVHRDLKPANIMVTPTGARRNALVLDFGIGALIDDTRQDDAAKLTLTRESIGTPAYAAPEQLRGMPPTPRSDLYSWGLVFVECLTGERCVRGESVAEIVWKQLSPEPIALPGFLEDHPLGAILRRVTSKAAERRDVSVETLLRGVEACDLTSIRSQSIASTRRTSLADAPTATLTGNGSKSWPRSRLIEGERRQITAVCCNLTVSGLGRGRQSGDTEELDQRLGREQQACADIARAEGGSIAGALGDSVVFYFGLPTAREDDARRAARAALAMALGSHRRNEAVERENGIRLEVRIGVHTGLVLAQEPREAQSGGLGHVSGGTPRLAARLASLAQPFTVLLSGATQRIVRRQFAVDRSELRVTNETTTPVEIFVLRDAEPASHPPDLPLVGRDREVARMLACFSDVQRGEGQGVIVTGDAGIGKSRLVREVERRIEHEAHAWLACRCLPDSTNSPFHPIIDLLDRLVDPNRDAPPEAKVQKLEAMIARAGFDLGEAMPLFTSLLSMPLPKAWAPLNVSAQKKRELTRSALLALLFELTEKDPVVFYVEDLHWADPSTLDLIAHVVRESGSARLLALFTARSEFAPSWPTSSVTTIHLGRLSPEEIEQLATRVARGHTLASEVVAQIAPRTDGIPLFAEELILTMIETGVLVEDGPRYALAKPIDDLTIPTTLRDALTARLDRLGRARETAQVASAIGREFGIDLLRAVSTLNEQEVDDDIQALLRSEIVYRRRRQKGAVYIFKHALVRDATYDSLLLETRRAIHARIAGMLEAAFPETVGERPDLLAQHHAAAGQMAEAVAYEQRAAAAALQATSYAEAEAHALKVVGWVARIEEAERATQELRANGILTQARMAQRGWADPEVKAAIDRSAHLLGQLGEASEHRLPTLWALFTYHHTASNRQDAHKTADEIVSSATRFGDRGLRAAGKMVLGLAYWLEGDCPNAASALGRSIELYDPAVHRDHGAKFGLDSLVLAKGALADVLTLVGEAPRAFALIEESLAWARELQHVPSLAMGLLYAAQTLHVVGDKARVAALADEVLGLSKKYGLPAFEGYAAVLSGWAKNETQGVDGILGTLDHLGCKLGLTRYGAAPAEVEASEGRIDDAIVRIRRCLAMCSASGERFFEPELYRRLGGLLITKGEAHAGEAQGALREAAVRAQRLGMARVEALAIAEMVRGAGKDEGMRGRLEAITLEHPSLRELVA